MSYETLRDILAKYDIQLDVAAMDTILAISNLPTSEIMDLFNDITIEDVFTPKIDTRLF